MLSSTPSLQGWDEIHLKHADTGNTNYYKYRGVYVTNGPRLGPLQFYNLMPEADTAQKDWIPYSGSTNFNMVNNPAEVATSYVSGYTNGNKDYYDIANLPSLGNSIVVGVQSHMVASSNLPASANIKLNTNIGGDEGVVSSSSAITSASRKLVSSPLMSSKPVSNGRWLEADVNSLKIGPEKT